MFSRALASVFLGACLIAARIVSGVLNAPCNDAMQWKQRTAVSCLGLAAASLAAGAFVQVMWSWSEAGFWAMLAGLALTPAGCVWAYLAHLEFANHSQDDE